jgi:hypothetical protein
MDHYIREMVSKLVSKGIVPHFKYDEAYKALSLMWRGKIALVWTTEDILEYAKDNDHKLTKTQALNILQDIEKNHDCSVGINFDTIDSYLP